MKKTITYIVSGLWFFVAPILLAALMSKIGADMATYLLLSAIITPANVLMTAWIIMTFDLLVDNRATEIERRNKEL